LTICVAEPSGLAGIEFLISSSLVMNSREKRMPAMAAARRLEALIHRCGLLVHYASGKSNRVAPRRNSSARN
jgi:hypothetical protein